MKTNHNDIDYLIKQDNQQLLIEAVQKDTREQTVELFKSYRIQLGITQAELGKIAGVSQPNVTRFESGKYNPSLDFMVKIATAMGKHVKIVLE